MLGVAGHNHPDGRVPQLSLAAWDRSLGGVGEKVLQARSQGTEKGEEYQCEASPIKIHPSVPHPTLRQLPRETGKETRGNLRPCRAHAPNLRSHNTPFMVAPSTPEQDGGSFKDVRTFCRKTKYAASWRMCPDVPACKPGYVEGTLNPRQVGKAWLAPS